MLSKKNDMTMKKASLMPMLLVVCKLCFADGALFGAIGSGFLFTTLPYYDYSYSIAEINAQFDIRINRNLFLLGDAIFHEWDFGDGDEVYDTIFPDFYFGLVGYKHDNFKIGGYLSATKGRYVRDYSHDAKFFAGYLHQFDDYNGVFVYGAGSFSEILVETSLKYRYGDRYQSVRAVQHRLAPSARSVSQNRLFFEIGLDFLYGYYSTDPQIDITADFDYMIDKNCFLNAKLTLFSDYDFYERDEWFPLYSFGITGYPAKDFRIAGSYSREKRGGIDDYYIWDIDWYYIEDIIKISAEYLFTLGSNGLSIVLDFQNISKDMIYYNHKAIQYGISVKYLWRDRDANIRDVQHRLEVAPPRY